MGKISISPIPHYPLLLKELTIPQAVSSFPLQIPHCHSYQTKLGEMMEVSRCIFVKSYSFLELNTCLAADS